MWWQERRHHDQGDDDTTVGDDNDDTTEPPSCLGVGFGASTNWALPDPGYSDDAYGNPGLDMLAGFEAVACGRDRYASQTTLDLTGDGVPDLVWMRNDCLDPQIGRDHWLVFEGAASGFAASGTEYALPPAAYDDVYGDAPFDTLGGYEEMDCGGRSTRQYVSWSTLDLTGDGLLDLVRLRDDRDDPTVGTDHWDVPTPGRCPWARPTSTATRRGLCPRPTTSASAVAD